MLKMDDIGFVAILFNQMQANPRVFVSNFDFHKESAEWAAKITNLDFLKFEYFRSIISEQLGLSGAVPKHIN